MADSGHIGKGAAAEFRWHENGLKRLRCPAVAGSRPRPCIPASLRKAAASVYPCECVTRGVLTETCALRALWKPDFTTGEPRFTLATSHLEKSIVFVSLALR